MGKLQFVVKLPGACGFGEGATGNLWFLGMKQWGICGFVEENTRKPRFLLSKGSLV